MLGLTPQPQRKKFIYYFLLPCNQVYVLFLHDLSTVHITLYLDILFILIIHIERLDIALYVLTVNYVLATRLLEKSKN